MRRRLKEKLERFLGFFKRKVGTDETLSYSDEQSSDKYGEMYPFFLSFKDKDTERDFNAVRGEQLKAAYVLVQFVILFLGIGTVYQATTLGFYPGTFNYSLITIFALSSMYLFYIKKSILFIKYTRYGFSICFMIMMLDTCEYIILRKDNISYGAVMSSVGVIFSYGAMGLPWLGCLVMG